MGDSVEEAAAKEARRRKIKQLEASLFGGDAANKGTTGLPELQRVGEYSAQYGLAERRKKESALPSIRKTAKKMFFPDPRRTGKGYEALNHSDEETEQLIDSAVTDGESGDDNRARSHTNSHSNGRRQSQQGAGHRRSSSTTTSANLLRSEVEQLDQSIKHLISDPKQEVIDNIKRRHGVNSMSRSPSFDPSSMMTGSVTNVAAAATGGLGRASVLDSNSPYYQQPQQPRRSRSMNSVQSDNAERVQNLDPRFANQSALPPPSSSGESGEDSGQRTGSSPMPEIKAALPVRGALHPIQAPTNNLNGKGKKKKGKKKFSLGQTLGLSSPGPNNGSNRGRSPSISDKFTDVVSYPESLPRYGTQKQQQTS